MEAVPELLDLVVGVLQITTVLFLAYGAYLAIENTGATKILGEPPSASDASPQGSRSAADAGSMVGPIQSVQPVKARTRSAWRAPGRTIRSMLKGKAAGSASESPRP